MGQDKRRKAVTIEEVLASRAPAASPLVLTPEQESALAVVNANDRPNKPGTYVEGPDDIKVRRPAGFLPPVPIIGDKDFQLAAQLAQRLIPNTDISKIMQGHTGDSMQAHMERDFKPDDFGRTNLLGIYGGRSKDVGIRPDMDNTLNFSTLMHELSHARGLNEIEAKAIHTPFELNPDKIESLLMTTPQRYMYRPKDKLKRQ